MILSCTSKLAVTDCLHYWLLHDCLQWSVQDISLSSFCQWHYFDNLWVAVTAGLHCAGMQAYRLTQKKWTINTCNIMYVSSTHFCATLYTVPCLCHACRSWLPSLTPWFRCVPCLPADWVQSTWQRTWSTVYISSTLPLHCTSSLNNDWKFFRHRYSWLPTCNLIYRLISQTTTDLIHMVIISSWYLFFLHQGWH